MRLNAGLDFGSGGVKPLAVMLRDDRSRQVVAEWAPEFLAAPLPLSPLRIRSLQGLLRPGGQGFGELPGLFGDSLPDGWGRLLMDRELLARGHGLSKLSDLHRLALVGRHGMGALVYWPEDRAAFEAEISLSWFEALMPDPTGATPEDLEQLRRMNGGSQGARPKFVAQFQPETTALRSHMMPPEPGWQAVLVKGRGPLDPPGSVEAELAYMRMAEAAGLRVTGARVLRSASGEAFFLTPRFDREGAQRFHVQTVAALLDADFRSAVIDYADLLKIGFALTRDHRQTEEIFRRMVFNILSVNRDDHLKNHAFLMGETGVWQAAPGYDLSFSQGPGGEHSLLIAGEGRAPGAAQVGEVARRAGLKPRRVTEIVGEVRAALARWPAFAEAAEVPPVLARQIGAAQAAVAAEFRSA